MPQLQTSFETTNLLAPKQGNRAMPVDFDFTNVGTITGDFGEEQRAAVCENIQSVYIDNSGNASTFSLTVLAMGPRGHVIQAQPFTQGWYPLPVAGVMRYKAVTTQGQVISCIFANFPMAYFVWGPIPGVLVVPALTSAPLNYQPLVIGDNAFGPVAVVGQTVKVYRVLLAFGGGANIQIFSGPSVGGNNLTGIINMLAGGSLYLQPSGVAWLTGGASAGLVLKSDAAVNAGGMIGYVQS
jgi:hypothetical protein